ncbi:hypothetical protein MYK68_14945 [Gordonia sp. PP30]|uniref:hypothetical protein n=1 Tax=Gordonia sp. PP30 TaxID=2935861 RepID=UPI001FFFA530|nr:hypothetical protein [Gordonia sp. PP30]UQE74023.1 hypothetical protein MYK68_14945 [Gordonia sp. PP30]
MVLHVKGCVHGADGNAQPFADDFCDEYDFTPNRLIDAVELACALRGMRAIPENADTLRDLIELEAEDREFSASFTRARTPEEVATRAANREAYLTDPAVRAEFDRDQAESEAVESEADELFETLRRRMTVEDYDQLFDELDVNDPDAVMTRLRAEVAALPATTSAKSNWRLECQALEDKLFTMTPGLRHVADTADALGAGRQGVLAVTLTRTAVAVGPHVRLLTPAGLRGTASQGGSLNFYTGLVGKPNAGKTVTMDAGSYLVPLPPSYTIPEGTGEGIVKSFGFIRREKHGRGEEAFYTYEFERLAHQVLMEADEVDGVFAEMVRQGTKFAAMWRSMWMGARVGTTTGNVELRTNLAPHTYRLGALLGCQPEATMAIWGEGGKGTPQRIFWAPVTRCKPNGKEIPVPLPLAYQPAPEPVEEVLPVGIPEIATLGQIGDPPDPRWIDWPPAARRYIEEELEALQVDDDPYGESDDEEEDEIVKLLGHSTFMRLKVMALLAIMDGLEQPADLHWEVAGVAMRLREMCMRRTRERAVRAGKVAAETRGVEQGVTRAAAKRGEAEAEQAFSRDLQARIIAVIAQLRAKHQTPTAAAITRRCSKKQQPHAKRYLAAMVEGQALTCTPAGVYSVN